MSEGRDMFIGSKVASNRTDLTEKKDYSNCEQYEVAGGKNSFHGVVYQLRLLMLFILKGLTTNYSFSLATEMKDAEKFDDVILRTKKESSLGGFSYRLLQAKHKGGESSKNVTAQAILSNSLKGDFSLRAYLESYLKLRPKFTSGQDEIRDLIICTNGKFKSKDSFGNITLEKAFEEMEYIDEIFQVKLLRLNEEGRRVTKDFLKRPLNGITPSERDIDSFLDKLHFAMDQYGNDDLEKQNKLLLQKQCCIGDIEMVYKLFENKIRDWMISPIGTYFDQQEAIKFIQSSKDKFGDLTFGFRYPVWNFIGRERELEEMEEAWVNRSKKIVVISGLGGMGKSELARKFISNNSSVFKRIVWITSDSQGSLISSFQRLAKRLGIGVEDNQIKSIIEDIYTFFGGKESVFVFDNVERSNIHADHNHYMKDFLPVKSNGPFVILTSRWQWNWENARNLSLTEIEQDDAKIFIISNLPADCYTGDDSIKKLAKQLQNYPLALQQAVAYITNKYKYSVSFGESYSIDNYLKTFEEEASQVLNCSVLSSSAPDYEKTTMTTWLMTFNAIENIDKKAVKILNLISHFAPDNIGPKNIFLYFDEADKDDVKKLLIVLKEFSVINLNCNKISIHRLVQKVIILKLKEKGKAEETLRWILKSVLDIELEHKISLWDILDGHKEIQLEYTHLPFHVMQSLIDSSRYEQAYLYGRKSVTVLKEICELTNTNLLDAMERFAWMSLLNMHIKEALTVYEDILKRIIKKVCDCIAILEVAQNQCELSEDSRIGKNGESNLKFGIANSYLNSGDITDALRVLDVVLVMEDFKKEILTQNILVMFNAMNGILKCNSNLGDKKEVLILFQKVYEKKSKIFGETHRTTLATKHEIAMLHSNLGDKAKALMILEEVYEHRRKILGENHKNTLATKYEIAVRHSNLGDNTKALTLLGEVYEARKETLGENHEHTLAAKHEIAMCHKVLGDKSKALMLLEEVYAKRMEIVGENQKNTLSTKHEMAMLHSYLGDKTKALTLLEEVYKTRMRVLGENHVNTLVTKHEIAMLHSYLGDKSKALTLLEEVHEIRIKILGENHINTLSAKHEMAMLHSYLGDKTKSLTLLEEVYKTRMRVLGENHVNTLVTKHEIAMLHSYLGDKSKALTLLEEVHEIRIKILGENHINTLSAKHEMAMLHSYLGDKTKALTLLEEVYKTRMRVLGENHVNTLVTKHEIALLHSYLGDKSKALTLLEDVHEIRIKILGENHINTLATKHEMAMLHSYLGNKTKALTLLEEVYKTRMRVLGENHVNTLVTKHEMAMLHSYLGDKTKALTLLEEVYENRIKILGENHTNTLVTKYEIAMLHSNLGDETKALMLLQDVFEKRAEILGENHSSTLATKNEIAKLHSNLGDKTKALTLLEELYEIRSKLLGENHELALTTKQEIAMCHSSLGDKTKALMLLEEVFEKKRDQFGENHPKTQATLKVITELKLASDLNKCSLF